MRRKKWSSLGLEQVGRHKDATVVSDEQDKSDSEVQSC